MAMNLSLVIPVLNEAESLPHLHASIHEALDGRGLKWEIVYVDDGSTDESLVLLKEFADQDRDNVRVVVLRRNFGQTAAISAGIDHTDGDVIVLMDADMQNDPQDIPMMLGLIEQGYDVVSGWRQSRRDRFLTRVLP